MPPVQFFILEAQKSLIKPKAKGYNPSPKNSGPTHLYFGETLHFPFHTHPVAPSIQTKLTWLMLMSSLSPDVSKRMRAMSWKAKYYYFSKQNLYTTWTKKFIWRKIIWSKHCQLSSAIFIRFQRPILNFAPRGKLWPQGWSCPPGVNFFSWGWNSLFTLPFF
jgi:hypothetical protein